MDIQTLLCTFPISAPALGKAKETFKTVHHYPDPNTAIPDDVLASTDVLFTGGDRISPAIKSLNQLPNLKHIQTCHAGVAGIISTEDFKAHLQAAHEKKVDPVTLSNASGVHVLSIPNYVVASIITLFHQLHTQWYHGRSKATWAKGEDLDRSGRGIYARKTIGRTVGFLGYGALGRESARLCKAHGMRVVAANTSGRKTVDNGYIIPGTGDREGDIPEKYFSTSDGLDGFLKECDVLVSSLPDTPKTRYILDANKLALLKPDALFINIGRGTLIRSEDILTALDAPNGLFGAALDVTDPEPLPDNHPLWTHPKCILSPHLSGDAEGEFDVATDILLENINRLRNGEALVNQVDFEKGY